MRNRVLSYFCNGPYQVESSLLLDPFTSTGHPSASTDYSFASTNSSRFVPKMEEVEAVEASLPTSKWSSRSITRLVQLPHTLAIGDSGVRDCPREYN